MKLAPGYMFLQFSTLCNSRCTTCSLWSVPVQHLPVEVLREGLRRHISPDSLRSVFFTGGEPFLPEDCVEQAVAMSEFRPGVSLVAATNSICPELYLDLFWPKVKPGGIMACHDYLTINWPGVKIAVDEFVRKRNLETYLTWETGGSIYWRKPCNSTPSS